MRPFITLIWMTSTVNYVHTTYRATLIPIYQFDCLVFTHESIKKLIVLLLLHTRLIICSKYEYICWFQSSASKKLCELKNHEKLFLTLREKCKMRFRGGSLFDLLAHERITLMNVPENEFVCKRFFFVAEKFRF